MNKNFEVITDNSIWKDKFSMEDIDYSILLAKVFGKPVETATAFMYLFRRYGYTNRGSDDYKELCSYAFHTNDKDVIVRWGMHYPSTYHFHLCAFVDKKKYFEWHREKQQPFQEWGDRMKTWAEKEHGALLFSMFELYKTNEDETKMEFIGTPEQEADILKIMSDNDIVNNDEEAFMKISNIKNDQYQKYFKEYEAIEPLPKDNSRPGIDFSKKYSNSLEKAEKQHEWILTFNEDHLIRKTYFAAMALFEDWKKPTNVRDGYFNLIGDNDSTFPKTKDEDNEDTIDCVGYSNHAGYGIPFGMFEGDNFNKVQEYINTLNSTTL